METSKRQGIFYVTNLAFKVYFKLNSVRLCQTFISNIRTGEVDLREFPMAQQVTYRYYLGRYFLYQNRLRKAEDHLRFAFEKCAAPCWKNKRLILQYLIPTRLLLGRFPMPQLLAKYQLQEQYLPLIVHLKSGNIAGYMSHIDQHFHYFYSTFTYMMLRERGTVLLWRCLIRKLYTIMRISNAAHIALSFETCLKALHFSSQDTTLDLRDMECILVSLVSQNYIRGYLHHQKHRLVLSKVNPFPPVSHIRVHTERYNEELVEAHLDDHQPEIPMEIQQLLDE
ncbi:uncharacterized protein BYT42DRAFT_500193 [Radiomyces spectabilis]|uniref:uncharacterized protein n=1 Tax=Radiomyces spectabilis TaxID=64574 RepID=UPI0022209800|nr:uncharacterized protein BYT42DRAFT_500193 [Radiomyces spectabilis]KAI8374387.1 hypothetical protein BYT42DRAFT_500193 [Radiomyces spectabilis]